MEQLIEFESLAAKKELDKESKFYIDTLDQSLKDENNKNIAITGGYGAGKTTIIDSYFAGNKEKAEKMMRVSIATFQNNDKDLMESTRENNLLEQQILQQMFYQVEPNRIANSKFTKLSDLSFFYIFSVLFYLLFTLVLTIIIINNNWLNQFYSSPNTFISFISVNWLWFLLLCLIIILNGISIWLLLMIFRKLGVTKFGVASTKIEFNFNDGSTVFNYYLDEIIYLFKKTNYEYIIFEDLDRFQNVKVFERLRSLNTSLNNSAQLKNRSIKFVYALKDDVFTGEDETESIYNRTKFFDFIIPTVKVLHSSNAESILLKKLKNFIPEENEDHEDENRDKQKLSKELIEDIALFINDMRTLINICNEFEVFRLRLQKSSVTYNNLFAFIVYKNIYPKDYSDLLENRGLVFDIFNKKQDMVRILENKINLLKNKSINGLGSIITDKNDIAMLFARKRELTGKTLMKGNLQLLTLSDNLYRDNYIRNGKEVFNFIIREGIVGEFTLCQNTTPLKKYSTIEEFTTIDTVNYLDLYIEFEEKSVKKEEEIQSQINDLSNKIKYVVTKSISRLIKEDSIDLHIDLTDKKLLHFLIRKNWLNESYEDYLTVFREGSISNKDNEFIQAIKLGETRDNLHLGLKNVKKVSEKIRVDDISSIAILNLDLIVYLLVNDNEPCNEKVTKINQILFNNVEPHIKGFLMLIDGLKNVVVKDNLVWKFLKSSLEYGIDIWNVVEVADVSEEQKENYVLNLLEKCNFNEFALFSMNNLREFISNDLNVTKLSESDDTWNSLKVLEIRFASVLKTDEESILKKIIQINSYQVNLENMRKILDSRAISIQLIKENKQVYDYCLDNSNVEALVTDVLIKQETYNEREDVFIEFIEQLVDNNIDSSIVESLIRHWTGVINDIQGIDSIIFIKSLYNEKKFKLTWSNIELCRNLFEQNDERFNIEELLSNENNWMELIENSSKQAQSNFRDKKKYNSFVSSILKLKIENHSHIETFISQLEFQIDLKEGLKIDSRVIELLIEQNLLSWNLEMYKLVNSVQHKISLIKDNLYDAREELPELIENYELVWSIELFRILVELGEIEAELIQQYIRYNIDQIEYKDFKTVTDIHVLRFDSEIINELSKETNKKMLLILYLTQQWNSGSTSDVADTIHNYYLPWSGELFESFLIKDVEVAASYLLSHIDKVDEVNMSQNLLKTLIEKSNSVEIVIKLINQYHDRLEIDSQISEKLYELLLSDSESIIETLSQNVVIGAIERLPLEHASRFLYQFILNKGFNRYEVFEFLSKLRSPFSLIKLNGGQIKITMEHANLEELFEYLQSKELQVISTIVSSDQGYLVNNKRK
ncbi:hypothetical protein [Gracilibacillus kekensis]|uniref:YobI-like P-loop NTPase domain-containing protein n=1 Tax=Gracilibacillus kekensis TaxID=1027249 RepID=A0A1M7Q238_9BACI|nr:hypothetical protein [Gracilibacillus kekensis]SHN24218.1 hypothetical protein SAMN05216179_2748 [Gracilibacillus kekensis]